MATIKKRKDGSYDITVTVRYHSRWLPPNGISESDQLQLVDQQAANLKHNANRNSFASLEAM